MTSKFNAPTALWLSAEDRETWAETRRTFVIVDVNPGEYKGQKRHTYTLLSTDPETGEQVRSLVALTDNDVRLSLANYVRQTLTEDPSGVGPCILEKVEADVPGGFVWNITAAPDDFDKPKSGKKSS